MFSKPLWDAASIHRFAETGRCTLLRYRCVRKRKDRVKPLNGFEVFGPKKMIWPPGFNQRNAAAMTLSTGHRSRYPFRQCNQNCRKEIDHPSRARARSV